MRRFYNLIPVDGKCWLFVVMFSLEPDPVVALFKFLKFNGGSDK
jgi:hypothetical protein